MKHIVVNGGHRTGSTLVYNIIRLLLLNSKSIDFRITDTVEEESQTLTLSKIHNYITNDPEVSCIYTYRNPHDVVASWIRYIDSGGVKHMFTDDKASLLDLVIDAVKKDMQIKEDMFNSVYCLKIPYNSLYREMRTQVIQICKHLGLEFSEEVYNSIKSDLNVQKIFSYVTQQMAESADPQTQLRKFHVSDRHGKPRGFFNLSYYARMKVEKEFGKYKEEV